jgi:hypothetical protein
MGKSSRTRQASSRGSETVSVRPGRNQRSLASSYFHGCEAMNLDLPPESLVKNTVWPQRLYRRLRGWVLSADSWFTPHRLRLYPATIIVTVLLVYAISLARGSLPFDSYGNPIAVDLTAHVTAGRIALRGDMSRLYDLRYQWEVQQGIIGPGHPQFLDIYLSPPFVAYLYAPLARLPYSAAAALWTALTMVLLLMSLRLLWPLVPNLHRYGFGIVILLALSSQPVFELLGDGQDSAVSLLLLVAGLRLLVARYDLLAGLILGLGLFKPQIFLLVPILLLCHGRWRALAGWVGVTVGLVYVSGAIIGRAGIHSYLTLLTSNTYRFWVADRLGWKMQSLVALVRMVLPTPLSFLVVSIAAAGGIGFLLVFIWRALKPTGDSRKIILLYAFSVLGTIFVSPHLFLYDCVIFLLPAMILLNEGETNSAVRLSLVAAYALTWTAPLRYLLFKDLPWPLQVMGGPWTVLPLFVLVLINLHSLKRCDREL